MVWLWAQLRLAQLRGSDEDGFATLEWVAMAGIIVAAAVVIAVLLMTKAKNAASNVNVQ